MDRSRTATQLQVVPSKESRTELLAWLNDLLFCSGAGSDVISGLQKVEQCGNGVPYVLILPLILPTPYQPLTTRAKIPAKHEFESVINLKLVADALQKNNIPRPNVLNNEVDKLIKGAYQANLQLLQWFRGLYNALSRTSDKPELTHNFRGEACDTENAETQCLSDSTKLQNACIASDDIVDMAKTQVDFIPETTNEDLALGVSTSRDLTASNRSGRSPRPASSTGKAGLSQSRNGLLSRPKGRPLTAESSRPQKAVRSPLLGSRGSAVLSATTTGGTTTAGTTTKAAPATRQTSSTVQGVRRPISPKAVRAQLSATTLNGQKRDSSPAEQRAATATKMLSGRFLNVGNDLPGARAEAKAPSSGGRGAAIRGSITSNSGTNSNANTFSGLTRPLVDCGNADSSSRVSSLRTRQQVASGRRSKLTSPVRSAKRSAPTGLFQARPSKVSSNPSVESQHVSTADSKESLSEQNLLKAATDERQFFYDKLRQIEILVAPLMDKADADNEIMKLARSVLDILYSKK